MMALRTNSIHFIGLIEWKEEEEKFSCLHLNMSLDLTNRNLPLVVVVHSIDYVRLVNIESHCLHFLDLLF